MQNYEMQDHYQIFISYRREGSDAHARVFYEKLKERGFDTANKIRMLDGRLILKNGLTGEMANIFDLQDAIRANHSELAWLMSGEDPKPGKKEAQSNADDGRSSGGSIYTEAYETCSN